MKGQRYFGLLTGCLIVLLVPVLLQAGDIHEAVKKGNLEAVQSFIKQDKALIDSENDSGLTPLLIALMEDQPKVAEFLIKEEANIHAKTKDGWTPLMLALRNNQAEIAAALIDKSADIHARHNFGWTALVYALKYDAPAIARRLVDMGADIFVKTNDGTSTLKLAVEKGYKDLLELFKPKYYRRFIEERALSVVVTKYPADAKQAVIEIKQAADRVAGFAGLKLVQPAEGVFTLQLNIEGKALSASYIGIGTRYSGARVSGAVEMACDGVVFSRETFYGNIEPPSSIDMLTYGGAASAPFESAINEAGSLIDILIEFVIERFGSKLLIPALNDAHPGYGNTRPGIPEF
jgi:hypothetical protein